MFLLRHIKREAGVLNLFLFWIKVIQKVKKNAVVCVFSAPDESFFFICQLYSRRQKPHLWFISAAAQVPSTSCSVAHQDKTVQLESDRRDCLFALWAKSFTLAVQTCLRSDFPQTHKTRLIFSERFFIVARGSCFASLPYYFSRAI